MKRADVGKEKRYHSYDGYGVDVSINRVDDLDRLILTAIAEKENLLVLDLGCGAGGQSVRMVNAGASVVGVDRYDFSEMFVATRAMHGYTKEQLSFIAADARQVREVVVGKKFDFVVMQRIAHYLQYAESLCVLKNLHEMGIERLFISVTGTASAIGDYCECLDQDVTERFCRLNEKGKDLFAITRPVCLYKQEEFLELLSTAGWKVECCWESAFGNHKAVCSR